MTTAWSLLLLAGDLFDSDPLYGQTAQELARSLARFRGHAVIAPGNHDFYAASSPYARLLWPENVHIFREERLQRLPFPQYGCVVYGAAFTSPDAPAGIPGSLGPEDEGLARILLLHGEVGVRDSRYRAMTLKDVEQSGADYLALGHVHAFGGVQQAGRTFWAYPGCPEGRGFDEPGGQGLPHRHRGTGTGETHLRPLRPPPVSVADGGRHRHRSAGGPAPGVCPLTRRRTSSAWCSPVRRRSRPGWTPSMTPCPRTASIWSCRTAPPAAGICGSTAERTPCGGCSSGICARGTTLLRRRRSPGCCRPPDSAWRHWKTGL